MVECRTNRYEFEEEKIVNDTIRENEENDTTYLGTRIFLKRFSVDFPEFQSKKLIQNGVETCILSITGYVWFGIICRRNTVTLFLMSHYLLTVLLVILFLAVP